MTAMRDISEATAVSDINRQSVLAAPDAAQRVRADHDLLLGRVEGLTDIEIAAAYRLEDGTRAGEHCDSLHDLLANVLMWDEFGLAVLTEARAGRMHWSVDAQWETRAARMQVNWSGVAAGRHLPAWLILHRIVNARDALVEEIGGVDDELWAGAGGTVQAALTAPLGLPFWHAAHYLRRVPYERHPAVGASTATTQLHEIAG